MQTPWNDLPIAPPDRLSRLRVNAESRHELFWFRDESGSPGLLIQVEQTVTPAQLRSFAIRLRNVNIDIVLDLPETGSRAMTIRLTDSTKLEVFSRLCIDIADRVSRAAVDESAFQIACKRLRQWQALFEGRSSSILTSHEIQGLFTELHFLGELLESNVFSEEVSVRGWKGPFRLPQDFILNDTAVEIKSLIGNSHARVRISSEDQLSSSLNRLFLRVYFLAEQYQSYDGENLNSIVRRISARITREDLREVFESALDAAGYIDLPEYDEPHLVVKDCFTFQVSDSFPRIIRNGLPVAIQSVSYDLALDAIESFRTANSDFLEN